MLLLIGFENSSHFILSVIVFRTLITRMVCLFVWGEVINEKLKLSHKNKHIARFYYQGGARGGGGGGMVLLGSHSVLSRLVVFTCVCRSLSRGYEL